MAALPYMQFHIAEYLADTAHLSTEEHGAYLLLIFNYWQRGKALDNSNGRLSNVVRMSNERWTDVVGALADFFEIDGDTWSHGRIERDLALVNLKCEQARNARSQRKNYARSTPVVTPVATGVQLGANEEKRIEESRREESNAFDPAMVASAVLSELGLSGNPVTWALTDIAKSKIAKGVPGLELVVQLCDAWRDYEKVKPHLSFTPMAARFFGDAMWENKAGWPWKKGEQPIAKAPVRNALDIIAAQNRGEDV